MLTDSMIFQAGLIWIFLFNMRYLGNIRTHEIQIIEHILLVKVNENISSIFSEN